MDGPLFAAGCGAADESCVFSSVSTCSVPPVVSDAALWLLHWSMSWAT